MKTRMTIFALLVSISVTAAPVGTEFTYQGVLSDAGVPASGDFDFRFFLYDAEAGGSQVGSMVLVEDLTVTDGRMTIRLDFGPVFGGTALWLEVGVRDGASTGSYTVLAPRQRLTAAPFAQHSHAADTAGTATTAGYAATAGNAETLDGQHGTYYRTWSNFLGIPGDLADGDDDTLADLICSDGEIIRWNGTAWNCGSDDDTLFVRTFVVGPVGTTTQNGTALRNAIAAITPPASQEEAVLLKLEPGIYDLGATGIEIGGWMTMEGAGRDLTKVTGAACGSSASVLAIGSNRSGLRRVSVENTCSDGGATAVAVSVTGADVTIEDARLGSIGAANSNLALSTSGESGGLWVREVELKVENGISFNRAVYNYRPGAIYERVTAEAIGGAQAAAFYNHRNDVAVRSSRLTASLGSIASRGIDNQSGEGMTLENVVAEAVPGDAPSTGINLQLATGTLVGVRAIGEVGISISGAGSSGFTLSDVSVDAVDDGIYVNNSEGVVMHNIVIKGAATGVGGNNSPITIMHSRISGTTTTVGSIGDTVTLEGVILNGGPVSGPVTCAGCIRNGTFGASGCP